jgi:hypothetical protein
VIANANPDAPAGTKKTQVSRANETFGPENVIATADDCDGTVLRGRK